MKVLILTNDDYFGFISELVFKANASKLVFKANAEHDVHAWYHGTPYPFDELHADYDAGISFMYQHKVPAKEVNSHPWFNFHPAPLPKYKGRDLCYHAIMNGERRFGATVHYMDENFDTGDIIEVDTFDVFPWDTAESISRCAINMSKTLFQYYLPRILETREFPRTPNVGGTYYKKGQIIEEVPVRPDDPFGQFVRAVTYKQFAPRIDIGGVKYKIVREE